jgi:hypothetical protein
VLEKTVEATFTDAVRVRGGACLKLSVLGRRGYPDRLVLYRGRAWFVELKRPGEEPRPDQERAHRKLARWGFPVTVVDRREQVEPLVSAWFEGAAG